MKLLWRQQVYGWWSVTGLVGKNADWFFGFSRKPPSPAQPLPPTTDPRTAGVQASALTRFNECGGGEEPDPLERLRFFCSLAMNGQDWLDVEQFFDAIRPRGVQASGLTLPRELVQRAIEHLQSQAIYTPSERNKNALLKVAGDLLTHVSGVGGSDA